MKKLEKVEAKNKKCILCDEQAEIFWPIIDIDIEAHPYCKSCAKNERIKLIQALMFYDLIDDDDE